MSHIKSMWKYGSEVEIMGNFLQAEMVTLSLGSVC